MSGTSSSIRFAKYNEFGMVCDLLADSFFDDPALALTFPNLQTRWRDVRTFFELACASARDAGTIAVTADGQGVVAYEPPSQPSDLRPSTDLGALMIAGCQDGGEAAAEFIRTLEANHPNHAPHYYLFAVGVRPGYRGVHGQALIGHVVSISERDGMPCYAETTSQFNRRLGHGFGYRDYGSVLTLSTGAQLYPLWRPDAAQSRAPQ